MEINIIENKKDKIVVEIKGEDHTFCNILVKTLQQNANIKAAAYKIEHPLRRVPRLLVETNGSISAKKALLDAASAIGKDADKFKKGFVAEVK